MISEYFQSGEPHYFIKLFIDQNDAFTLCMCKCVLFFQSLNIFFIG